MNSPSAPDPTATANTQQGYNIGSATAQQRLNMVDQSNPLGSLSYSQTGTNADGTPKFAATTSLSAPMSSIFNGVSGAAGSLANSGAGALGGKGLDLSWDGTASNLQKLTNSQLDPRWNAATDSQEAKLAAQGLTPGMAGYTNAMSQFNQGKNNAYQQADLGDYQQAVNNATTAYNAPVSALGSMLGIAKSAGSPTFASTPTASVQTPNYAGLTEQNYQQQAQNANAQNGQIAGLLGTGLSAVTGGMTGGLSSAMGGLFGGGGGSSAGYGNFGQYSPYSPTNAGG